MAPALPSERRTPRDVGAYRPLPTPFTSSSTPGPVPVQDPKAPELPGLPVNGADVLPPGRQKPSQAGHLAPVELKGV